MIKITTSFVLIEQSFKLISLGGISLSTLESLTTQRSGGGGGGGGGE